MRTSSSKAPASLNDLHVAGRLWFASDMHLSGHSPATNRAFITFLQQATTEADALFLLGDVFEVWTGDDLALKSSAAWLDPILAALRQTAEGCPLYLGRGNRDFLMGQSLARSLGARLLPEQIRLHTDFGCALVSHGDEYCTADKAYQRFRRWVRNPALQRMFLALAPSMRQAIADWARSRSRQAGQRKSMSIMDVQPEAIHDALERSGCQLMIHGHTHRPAIHPLSTGGPESLRIVLPDWDYDDADHPRGGWLVLDGNGPQLVQRATPPSPSVS